MEQLDIVQRDKKQLADMSIDVINRFESMSSEVERLKRELNDVRGHLKETEKVSQQAHELLNRTANELTQVQTHPLNPKPSAHELLNRTANELTQVRTPSPTLKA